MYFSPHHHLFGLIGKITGRVFLMPHPTAIGNALEDYLFGLMYAKKNNRKLVTIVPCAILRKTGLKILDSKYLTFSNELTQPKYGSNSYKLFSTVVSIMYLVFRIVTMIMYKMFKINLPDTYFHPSLGQDVIWKPYLKKSFDWQTAQDLNWPDQFDEKKFKLTLPAEIEYGCSQAALKLGLPPDAWYVCLHVREGGYSKDEINFRNSDIENYLDAIKYITSQGGWVIRMGDSSMQKLPSMVQVIDYANHPDRNALLDIFLIKGCDSFIGTSSGMIHVAELFDKPMLFTNAVSYLNDLPQKIGDLIIFKHVKSKSMNRTLSLKEWLNSCNKIETKTWSSEDWEYIQNTSGEILIATKQFLGDRTERTYSELQREFKDLHLLRMKSLSGYFKFSLESEVKNVNEWYRFSSRYLSWRGEIGADFLANHW
jgi:putative glycosyltransferase (TIGR04372 family)